MSEDVSRLTAERDHYRASLHHFLIDAAATEAIAKFGGRTKFLKLLVTEQLAVREDGHRFDVVVVDRATDSVRAGVTVSDLLTEMRDSDELSGAFDAKLSPSTKLSGNPWAPDSLNLTRQALLLRRNPALAARYRREASAP